ncbi:hypothetical protein V6N13_107063 [Hibiscus sabdariffa]
MRRHLSLSDKCSICINGVEDIEHVLRKCTKAHELWFNILEPDILDTFLSTPFDDWMVDNLRYSSNWDNLEFDWSIRFSIFCWLLWKTRCCELFDLDSVTRESILDRGNRLIAECNQVFSRNKVNIIRPVRDGNLWKGPGQGWVKVRHVPREMNGAADKLAAMGRGYSKEGRLLIAPPDMVVTIVNDEQCRWLEGLHAHSDDPAI